MKYPVDKKYKYQWRCGETTSYLECLDVGGNGQPVPVGLDGALQVPPLALYLRLLPADILGLWTCLGAQPAYQEYSLKK